MKCQSDYDTETDVLLKQADECIDEWWEGAPRKAVEPSKKGWEEDASALIVRGEVRRRGLIEVSQDARV